MGSATRPQASHPDALTQEPSDVCELLKSGGGEGPVFLLVPWEEWSPPPGVVVRRFRWVRSCKVGTEPGGWKPWPLGLGGPALCDGPRCTWRPVLLQCNGLCASAPCHVWVGPSGRRHWAPGQVLGKRLNRWESEGPVSSRGELLISSPSAFPFLQGRSR